MLTKINRRFKFLTVLFVVAVTPIIIAASVGVIPNKRWYWNNFYDIDAFVAKSSEGYVTFDDEKIIIGNLSHEESSSITLTGYFWQRSFIRQEALNATSASLEISFEPPRSTYVKTLVKEIGWIDDDFTSDWVLYARTYEGGDARTYNGTLDVSANFNPNNRIFYLLKRELPGINTTAFPYFLVKWRSTDHVARLELYRDSGDEFKVILDSADGIIYPGTFGGGYSEDWVENVYRLPPDNNITRIVLGADSGGGGGGSFPVSGVHHAYFDYVQFIQTEIGETSYIRIEFNNQTLLNENLTYPVQPGVYSLNSTKYATKTFSLPINASLLDVENSLFISVGQETIFNVTSLRITMNTYPEKVTPAWHDTLQDTGILYAFVVGDVLIAVLSIKRLLKWLNSLCVENNRKRK